MAEAKTQSEWSRMSYLLALLVNINRDKRHRPIQPYEMNPYHQKKAEKSKPDFYITPAQFAKVVTQNQ